MTGDHGQISLVTSQMAALQARYPGLALVQDWRGSLAVQGKIRFYMEHQGRSIEDVFDIAIKIPPNYPKSPPCVYETKGKLAGFDHLFQDGKLCLGAPVEVRAKFSRRARLLNFIEDMVIPFLFSFSYKKRYGEMPFGELAHGMKGILDYYTEFFGTSKERAILLLECLAYGKAPPLEHCPCGSGRRLGKCHGPRLDALRPHQAEQEFRDELREIVFARLRGQPHQKLLPRRLRRRIARRLSKSKTCPAKQKLSLNSTHKCNT